MAKSEKYFEIPRGNEQESDEIRQALIDKIKQQEQASQRRTTPGNSPYPNYQPQQPQAQQPQAYQQQPVPNYAAPQNSPYQQVQQAPSQVPQQVPQQRPANNPYAGYGAYSSPFAEDNIPNDNKNNLVDATHSKEPVKYKPKKRRSAGKTFLILIIMVAIIFGLS